MKIKIIGRSSSPREDNHTTSTRLSVNATFQT